MSATQERSYLDELLEDENYNLTFHIEEALVEAAEKIKDAMADANINRTKIAQKLKISLPQVSRALNGSHNLTVRTLASMLWASGKKLTIDYTDIQEEEEQQLALSFSQPDRYKYKKIWPNSKWELMKPGRIDYLGFFGSWVLVGIIIFLLWLMVSIK